MLGRWRHQELVGILATFKACNARLGALPGVSARLFGVASWSADWPFYGQHEQSYDVVFRARLHAAVRRLLLRLRWHRLWTLAISLFQPLFWQTSALRPLPRHYLQSIQLA